jgi:hypothetical protein
MIWGFVYVCGFVGCAWYCGFFASPSVVDVEAARVFMATVGFGSGVRAVVRPVVVPDVVVRDCGFVVVGGSRVLDLG